MAPAQSSHRLIDCIGSSRMEFPVLAASIGQYATQYACNRSKKKGSISKNERNLEGGV